MVKFNLPTFNYFKHRKFSFMEIEIEVRGKLKQVGFASS